MSSIALFRTDTKSLKPEIARSGPVPVDTSLGRISLTVTNDLKHLEEPWEALQEVAPCTPPQTYAWACAWARHMLAPEGRQPVIALGHAADGTLLFLWPFEVDTKAGLTLLTWLGQARANYNMGLFAPGAAVRFGAQDISRLLEAVAREADAVAAILTGQPFDWDGVANPFATLPQQPAPSQGYAATLGNFTAIYRERLSKRSRHNLERKERRLAEAAPLHYGWAETSDETLALIDTIFTQKSRQLAAVGVKTIFDARARAFYRDLALMDGDNPSRLRLGYLKVGDTVAATFSGSLCHNRLSVVFSTLGQGEHQKQSPGALLLWRQIEEACNKGIACYDIGVGPARHKDQWCDRVQPLFDSFIAFKPRGLLLTLPLAGLARVKRAIKSSKHLWPLAQAARRTLFARGTSSSA